MSPKWSFRRIFRTIWVVAGLTFMGWLVYSYQAHGVGDDWLEDTAKTGVKQTEDFFSFTPKREFSRVMFFYPGAMVDPEAYVPLCRQIADSGTQVFLLKMPWRMAIYGYRKPLELNLMQDMTKSYILTGHSQGAKMAEQFVYENPALADRLILIATTHPRDISLADHTIPVLKIYGSHDGVAGEDDILANRSKLPDHTEFIRIEGANHSQFGYYGFQFGDNTASISRDKQQSETLKQILSFIR